MAHNEDGFRLPLKVASTVAQYVPVRFVGDPHKTPASALSETVVVTASWNELALGMSTATGASPGDPISIQFTGVCKGIAGASLGAGAPVGIGSTNGVLAPILATGGPASANLVATRFAVGIALKNAAAGDYFPVLLKPDQIL